VASVYKRGGKWRAEVRRRGVYLSDTFGTKAAADRWAAARERELEDRLLGRPSAHTVQDAFERYGREVTPKKPTCRNESQRIARILASVPFAHRPLAEVQPAEWVAWRDGRKLKPASQIRDFALIRHVYSTAVAEWRWLPANPILGAVRNPPAPRGRTKTWQQAQIDAQGRAMDWDGVSLHLARQRAFAGFLLALETGMRLSEIFTLPRHDVHLERRFVHLELTKNGSARDVPLSTEAGRILELVMAAGHDPVFGVWPPSAGALFAEHRPPECAGLTFHDSRHTAATRLGMSGQLTPLELAAMFGWRNLNQAMTYFNPRASDLAAKLG
jgi:integrase